jgi:hypothetical protein
MADPYCPIVTLVILLGVPTILLVAVLARLVIVANKGKLR